MSHESFLAKENSLLLQRCAFKHIILDASLQSLPPQTIDLARALPGRPSIFLLTSEFLPRSVRFRLFYYIASIDIYYSLHARFTSGSHPARGTNLDLKALWPLLLLIHPNSWHEIQGAVQELLDLLPPTAAQETLMEITDQVQVCPA
jgi:hypothetical protein